MGFERAGPFAESRGRASGGGGEGQRPSQRSTYFFVDFLVLGARERRC